MVSMSRSQAMGNGWQLGKTTGLPMFIKLRTGKKFTLSATRKAGVVVVPHG